MGDLQETNVAESEEPMQFGGSEATKLAQVLQNHKQSVEYSLQQTIRTEKLSHKDFKGLDQNTVRLGPCFKSDKVKEVLDSLKECFPAKFSKPPFLNEPEKLVCHWVRTSNKPTNGWTCSIDTRPWFDRLSSRHDCWKKLRIYEFLRLSTYPRFPFYDALTAGLMCCWNPCLNVFTTGQGFRTITLEDIAFITGLSPSGIDLPTQTLIEGALDMEKIHPWKTKSNMPFSPIAEYYNPSRNKSLTADISRKEEVLFINFSICKMMMFPSCNVNKTFLKLAANIEASGSNTSKVEPLCLAPLFLGQVYRCLYRLRTQEKLYTAGGPVWIISIWGLFYFPFLAKEKGHSRLDYEELEAEFDKPTAVPVNECCCYGEVAIHSVSPVVHLSFEEVLRGLLSSRELSQSDWHPFSRNHETGIPLYLHDAEGSLVEDTTGKWMNKAAPLWLLDLSCMDFREGDQLHWLSVWQPRDLMCVEPKGIGVEAYNPNLVARQFGMTQGLGIPYYKTLNRPWGTRPNILDAAPKSGDNRTISAETWLKSIGHDGLSSSQIIPWFRRAAVDSGYELWWADYLKRCEVLWPDAILTLVQQVEGRTQIDRTLATTQASTNQNSKGTGALTTIISSQSDSKGTGALTTIVSSQSNALSKIKNSTETTLGTRGQKRKTEKDVGSPTSKKAIIEEASEPDDAIVTLMKRVQRRIDRTLSTTEVSPSPSSNSTGVQTPIVAALSLVLSQIKHSGQKPHVVNEQKTMMGKTSPATSSLKKGTTDDAEDSDDDIPLSSLRRRTIHLNSCNGNIQRNTNIEMNPTPQNLQADVPDDRLNSHKKGVELEGAATHDNEEDLSQTGPDFPENLGTITSEEAVVEVVTPEPEDSLEPPHEMIRGMGSPCLNDAFSIPSVDLNSECLDLAVVNPSCSSFLRGVTASVKGEAMEEELGARDPVTPEEMSRALIVDGSTRPDTSLCPWSLEGVSYTPDKALAEVNSVVMFIEDTLRPFPNPSAFDAEKLKAEEIVGILQSNVKDLEACVSLADQIHRLLMVAPPQFQPILVHYQTSFLSLGDQLRNIQEQENMMTYNADSLNQLSTVAKDLRDRLETTQSRIDQLRAQCSQYDKEIGELEAKLVNLKQRRESKLEELSMEENKFGEFSSTLSDTIPTLQKAAQTMVSARQSKAQWECTLKTIKDNVRSFVELLKSM
ncbi:uncharacterized protein LOC141653441 isoform X2 [Silene latifolia]|uniref:uncharacterized protein LOC141653441 isoform X2 n=1 Tax=Silene latifolia TaxID=37657 RepID=UPI003D779DD2